MESETWWTESKTKETESETNGTDQGRNQRNETEKITGKETSWTENKTKRAGKEPQRLWENYWLGKGIFFVNQKIILKGAKSPSNLLTKVVARERRHYLPSSICLNILTKLLYCVRKPRSFFLTPVES